MSSLVGYWVLLTLLGCRDARVLRKATGLLGIGYCMRLLGVWCCYAGGTVLSKEVVLGIDFT